MARILSIDYGRKRTGLAVTDPLQIIANGLTTVATADLERFLLDYLSREEVERIVVGLPKSLLAPIEHLTSIKESSFLAFATSSSLSKSPKLSTHTALG